MSVPVLPSDILESGSFATAAPVSVPTRLVLATYNIRYAAGAWLITQGLLRQLGVPVNQPRAEVVRRHIQHAARALRGQPGFPAPDIIAVQEADAGTIRAGKIHVARELARELGYYYAHAASQLPHGHTPETRQWCLAFEENITPDDTGDTGVALLSRFPLTQPTRLALPWTDCPWRPRLGLGADLQRGANQPPVRILTAHIDPHAPLAHQLKQHETVLEYAAQSTGPAVFLGDFNTLTPRTRRETRRFLEAQGWRTPMPDGTATWRAGFLANHTDWIFVRGLRLRRWGVARRVRHASDHWPVWAEMELPDG